MKYDILIPIKGEFMNCPKCGSKLDTGYNCTKCDYRYRKIEDTTKMTSKQIQVIDGEFMERLTVKKGQEYDGTADMLKVYYRLADYEDIGTVEELRKLKAENESLKKQNKILAVALENALADLYREEHSTLEREEQIEKAKETIVKIYKENTEKLIDKMTAKLENSVQLPCKVGDEVYTVYNHWNYPNQLFVQPHRVDKFMVWNKDTILTIAHTGNFGLKDLGKIWFLDKQQAEARLKELEENEKGF